MNIADISLGWKVYTIAWVWLGLTAWFIDSLGAAIAVWFLGASAGWLLVSTVRDRGWAVVSRYAGYGLSGAVAIVVAAKVLTDDAFVAVLISGAIGALPSILRTLSSYFGFVFFQRRPHLTPDRLLANLGERIRSGPTEQSPPEVEPRCPQCGKYVLFRSSGGQLRCYCGFRSS